MNEPKGEETIFAEALRLPPEERAAYLAQATHGNAELRQRVESLLGSYGAGDFLEQAAAAELRPTRHITVPLTEKAGDTIGRYKLLQQIGEGGCGVVYMAEQAEPVRRRVALKIIKLGMDTKSVIARFEAERQAVAMMDHPNIAKVFDAGATETGRPYFVMELVRGMKITDYCDEAKLSTRARLDLFIQVCQAIQHAHQKGIIHRDIKPSNILVSANDGVLVPKVIDFGIAKATSGQQLTDKTLFTAFEQFIGTPAYMSPEQAVITNVDIDTRSDIYALGVLLYEMLTGKTPFDAKELLAIGLDEMRRTIREQEPPRPSTRLSTLPGQELSTTAQRRGLDAPKLVSELRGDLDWIVMKALEKDRARRYETANGLAMDIQRHLNNEPVVACPPSSAYRFQKLVRRNKPTFAAAAALSTILVLGVVVSSRQAIRATRSEREQSRLRETAQQAQANEARLRQEAEADKKKAESEAAKSQQVARFLRDMLSGVGPSVALGRDTTMLREILDKTAERVGQDLTNHPQVEAELRDTIGEVYQALGQYDKAETMYRQALAIERKWQGNENINVAHTLNHLASVLRANLKPGGAEPFAREALAIQRKLFGNDHPEVADAIDNLAKVLQTRGRLAEAEKMFRETLGMRRKLFGPDHPDVASSLVGLAGVLQRRGELAEAETTSREALALQRKFLGDENPAVAVSLYRLGVVLLGQGKLDQAEIRHREALALRRKLYGSEHRIIVESLTGLADVLCRQGKLDEVHQLFRQELANAPNPYPYTPRTRPDPLYSILGVLLTRQEFSRAELLVDELLTPEIEHQPQSVGLLVTRANYFARRSRWQQAATDFGKVVQLDPTNTGAWCQLAPALIESGDLKLYEQYRLEMSKRFVGTSHGTIAKACLLLPADGEVLAVAVKIAETESIVGLGDPFYPYIEFARGLAELRQRQYASAKEWLDKTLAHGWSDGNLVAPAQALLSIVHYHLGRPEDARANLAKAVEKAQSSWPRSISWDLGGSWYDWIMVQIFLREAQALIEGSSETKAEAK